MTRPIPLLVLGLALLVGVVFRFYPVIVGQPQLSQFFVTEDGYLLLTVARNMAIGLGMSVSDGTIPTNGVQPLITFLFSGVYLLNDGDKVTSLFGVHWVMIAISVAAFFAIRAFAKRVLQDWEQANLWAAFAAALWFLGTITLRHSMNALETGLITLMLMLTLLQFYRVIDRGLEVTLADRLLLGALAGVAFLARIDAALFCVILWGVWMLDMLIRQRAGFKTTFLWLLVPGLVCVVIAAPWLLNNALRFGSLMPSSGTAQSLTVVFGQNAHLLPSRLFEYSFPMLPVPNSLDTSLPLSIALGSIVALIMLLFLVRSLLKAGPALRIVIITYTLYLLFLGFYYGFNYGAPHFLSRYLAPTAPLLIVASLWAALELGRWVLPGRADLLAKLYGFGGLVLCLGLIGRMLMPGVTVQGHFQVVDWVSENVPEETWVGAVQTGTLGYWHDRTINLDGKVNPEALAVLVESGSVLPYVIESEIEYVIDWASVSNWADRTTAGYNEVFELIVLDEAADLSVQQRRSAQ